jgi:hypothetical protein
MPASSSLPPLPFRGLSAGSWDAASAAAHELFEALDDSMFAAIGGDAAALETARTLWASAIRVLPAELVDESRDHYLRFAAEAAKHGGSDDGEPRSPALAVAALEVVELLAQE